MPPGHAQAVRKPRQFGVREKWFVGGVLALLAALVVGLTISFTNSGHSTGHGCVDVTFAYITGGQELYKCGAAARATCSAVGAPGGYGGDAGRALATECRKVGLRVGP